MPTCRIDPRRTLPRQRVEETPRVLGRSEVGQLTPFHQHQVFDHVKDLARRLGWGS